MTFDPAGTDGELAGRIAAGDRAALETVFKRIGGSVKAVARNVLRDDALAEDVTQDVFIGFWKDPVRFDPSRGTLRSYLLRIAHRRAVDLVRSEEARSRREEKVPMSSGSPIDEEVWQLSLEDDVATALRELNAGEREAITMAYFGGFTYAEVARRLETPEGTVKSRIRSGMKKLSVSLEGLA